MLGRILGTKKGDIRRILSPAWEGQQEKTDVTKVSLPAQAS